MTLVAGASAAGGTVSLPWPPVLVLFAGLGCALIGWACLAAPPAWLALWLWLLGLWCYGKLLTWWPYRRAGWRRSCAYLLVWPGMDPAAFFPAEPERQAVVHGAVSGWAWLAAGVLLLWGLLPLARGLLPDLVLGWAGVMGLIWILHCGTWRLAAALWSRRGVAVQPPMRAPLLAGSIGEFWSRRWNLPFHGMLRSWVFAPTRRRWGVAGASLLVFLVSGLLHEVMTSVPAGGGYGLVTAYFLLQWAGLWGERLWRRLGPVPTRLIAWVVVLGGAPLLFHPPFIRAVILPLLAAIGALD